MKDYYRILEVTTDATPTEIKKSYRRLARTYHPDRNSSTHAEALFKEINAAYEVLGDPVKRWEYDNRLAVPPPATHRDPAVRRRPAAYRPGASGPSETYLAMAASLPYLRFVFYVGVVFCFVLAVDFLLPATRRNDRVESNAFETRRGSVSKTALITKSGKQIEVAVDEISFFPIGSQVEITTSRLFSILIGLRNLDSGHRTGNLATVYRLYSFGPLILLVISILGLVYFKRVEFAFNLAVVGFFVIWLTIFFFFQSIP